ncbi:division/cell wall cluster transcriptional repressor MraZ [Algiphilus sp.]|uniref:division/cell wall cluster transcriptional repressor MraZ n=1 Tax=Algiphilus sp. TaxID=1872431 RepID=UPI001CA6E5D8|nr:division/cell wall cluster transcriptional repressor MraZ [Algiphilus sp.]MBY8965885.1 division/cell wall cluster transcriptional repressor MraZ [Algiphilus acroporae]MCI5062684.1 division/cell wall cluster transcriptional repressor MraZ [Algiphilus sp.]MCI5104140.1 division/cell wall cluster transcriptional repressor MraZ [Algiphilus sp.]MCR9091007.1 division/cell wall cluster transcriptional repressor MraZ [Pseudomonadota bacterium]
MFTGEHPLNVDDKGRLAVPARFRQQLADSHGLQLYITIVTLDDNPRLEIYPAPVFRDIAEQIQQMEDRDLAEALKLGFVGRAVEAEIDRQGRIVLPPLLRRDAGIGNRAMLVGQITRFDVWDQTAYEATRVGADQLANALKQIRR